VNAQNKPSRHPLLTTQHRRVVARAADLEASGLTRPTIYRRCLPGGPWRRLLPGIIQLDPVEPGAEEMLAAALLRGGKGALVTGLWAARRHGLTRTPEPELVHLLVPADCHVTSSGFVLVERTTRMPGGRTLDGKDVAPVHRAVLDAARRMRDFDAIRAMLAEAIQRGMCTPQMLRTELARGSQRGTALPRRALAELLGRAQSVAEGDGFWLWRSAGLPEGTRNVRVVDADGKYVGTPDMWVDDQAMAWEVDSRECHFDVDGYAATLDRNNRYTAAGIVFVQTRPSRIRKEPDVVIAELRAAYAAACRRPRPPVRIAA